MSAVGITIKQGSTTLADGTPEGGQCIGDIIVNDVRLVDVVDLVRAEEVLVFARGNRKNTVRFQIDEVHSSLITSRKAQFDVTNDIGEQATLTMIFTDGVDTLTVTLPAAGWIALAPKYGGVSLTTEYEVVGGLFTTVLAAADSTYLIDGTAASPDTLILASSDEDGSLTFADYLIDAA